MDILRAKIECFLNPGPGVVQKRKQRMIPSSFYSGPIRLRQGCFRSLLLVGCPHLLLTKALVPDLKPTTIGEVKFTPKVFQSNAYSTSTNN
jgi:hypothetical protein